MSMRFADGPVEVGRAEVGAPAVTVAARTLDERLGVEPVGWREESPDHFAVQVAPPPGAADARSAPHWDWRDPVLAARAVHRGALLIAAEKFAVPADHRRVLHGLSCSVEPGVTVPDEPRDGPAARPVTLHMAASDVEVRRGQLISLRFQADLALDGEMVGSGTIRFGFLSPAVARFLRARQPADPSDTGATGSPGDAPEGGIPLTFDGVAGDHIPGILLLAACAQAARYTHGSRRARLVAAQVEFPRFADPVAPATARLRPVPGQDSGPNGDDGYGQRAVDVTIRQRHGNVLTGRLTSQMV